eukprot:5317303-Alexandrium_andersonii.AAC.1
MEGDKYVLAYICCRCHGVLLEPCRGLKHSEARRAFARCLFRAGALPVMVRIRAGALPVMVRSYRGVEFKSVLMQ